MDDVNEQDNEERFYHNPPVGVNIMGQIKNAFFAHLG